jgi:hypothetical protein
MPLELGVVVERIGSQAEGIACRLWKQNPPFPLEFGAAGDGRSFAAPGLGPRNRVGRAPCPCSASVDTGPCGALAFACRRTASPRPAPNVT